MNFKDSDIDNWPKTWACSRDDIEYGKGIVKLFCPFINSLIESDLSRKTINSHIDNLWVLGGFLIKQINCYEEDKKKEPLLLIPMHINEFEGPTIFDLSEYEQESFDRTCRKYYSYLVKNDLK